MNIFERLQNDLTKSMKCGDSCRISTLRLILNSVYNERLKTKNIQDSTSDDKVLGILKKEEKQRMESIEAYKSGNRSDLVEVETRELNIIREYLPKQVSDGEIRAVVIDSITEFGKDFGKIMKNCKTKFGFSADGNTIKTIINEVLCK